MFPSLIPQVRCVSVSSSHDALGRVGVGQDAAGCGGSGQRSRGACAVSAAAVDVFSLREHLQTGSDVVVRVTCRLITQNSFLSFCFRSIFDPVTFLSL